VSDPLLVHVTTTDISLELLLGPQLRAFRDAGYEVVGASAPGPYADRLVADGIEHVSLRNATRSMAPHRDLAALGELYRLFRKRRPAIVHTHNPKPGLYGRIAARAARVPVVVNTVHGLYATPDDRFLKRTVVYSLERLAATCSDAELLQNPEDEPVLRRLRVPPDKITILGNGVDLERFGPRPDIDRSALRAGLGVPADAFVLGAVGRLVWEKGYRDIFDAAELLAGTHPNVHVVVAGPQDPEKRDGITTVDLEEASRRGNVHFLGERLDVEALYHAFDAYVLASYREGFPRSAMEAAASGLPIIATDIRGCRQVVTDGVNGLLVPTHSPTALAAAVSTLADDNARRTAMGHAGLAKARTEFDQQQVIELTLATYRRLLDR
jgi:glycosyltransferase involved in cell wall biosynthesis